MKLSPLDSGVPADTKERSIIPLTLAPPVTTGSRNCVKTQSHH